MEEELILATKIILSVFLGGLVVLLLHLYDSLLVKPKKLRSRLQEEGINGHSPSFLLGNIPDMKRIKLKVQAAPKENHNNVVPIAHDWPSTNFPYFDQWGKEYGTFFFFLVFKNNIIIIMEGRTKIAKQTLELARPYIEIFSRKQNN